MTCSLEMADGDAADDEVVLSWLDDGGEEVSSVTGRYDVMIPWFTVFILTTVFTLHPPSRQTVVWWRNG